MKLFNYLRNEADFLYKYSIISKVGIVNNFTFEEKDFCNITEKLSVEDKYRNIAEPILFVENADFVCSRCSVYAFTTYMHFKTGASKQIIFIDENFKKLSDETKKFIICHELAHLELIPSATFDDASYVRNDKDEFEADEVATSIVGKEIALKAFEEMRNVYCTLTMNTEFKKRINRIKNM